MCLCFARPVLLACNVRNDGVSVCGALIAFTVHCALLLFRVAGHG